MTDNIKLPPMPKAHTVVKPKDSEPFGLITTRDALNFAAEAVRLNAQAVPDGWVLVPKEPTPEMLQIGRHAAPYRAVDVYRAMLSAAPAAPQPAHQPLTDEQINAGRLALPYDIEDKPEPWAFKEGVRFAERKHGIGVKNER